MYDIDCTCVCMCMYVCMNKYLPLANLSFFSLVAGRMPYPHPVLAAMRPVGTPVILQLHVQ